MAIKPLTDVSIICSLCEDRYAYGLATLLNSSIENGFRGLFYIVVRDKLPFWINTLEKRNDEYILNENCTLKFDRVSWDHHLSYYKPFLIENLNKNYPSSNIFYFDPDITIECDWRFFEDWVEIGPALCSDGNYPVLGKKHPWVISWKYYFEIDKINTEGALIPYINSGFIGIKADYIDLIKVWIDFTYKLINKSHDLKKFGPTLNNYKQKRAFSICGDQDILNAVLLSRNFEISLFGVDGMGFNGSSYLMYHNIGIKTWDKNFLKEFLKNGNRISKADDSYFKYIIGTINLYNSKELFLLKLNIKLTKLLQRIL